MATNEFPTLQAGQALTLEAEFRRYSDPPRTTALFRLVFEITALSGQPVTTPGRCSVLELNRPEETVALRAADTFTLRGWITKANAPNHTKNFGHVQLVRVDGLRLNDVALETEIDNRFWVARPGQPSKIDRLTVTRMSKDALRRGSDRHEPIALDPPVTMTLGEVMLSTFLQNPTEVLARLDEGDMVIRRRDAQDLRLSLDGYSRDRDAGTALVAHMLAELVKEGVGRDAISRVLQRSLAWMDFLPSTARDEFLGEFLRTAEAGAQISTYAPLMQLLREWRETAEIYADPELTRELTRPLPGGAGPVPEPVGDYAQTR
ncbi:MAG: hypothetical protein ACRDZO_02755 [Egibacteraceae bacterium]